MESHALLTICLAALLWAPLACEEGATARVCDPRRDDECGAGEFCTVDTDGVPYCAARPDAALMEMAGEMCSSPEMCGEGLGCIDLYGASRCTPFCTPGLSPTVNPCLVCEGEGEAAICRTGNCIAALPDRVDIGVCLLPCDPTPDLQHMSPLDVCPSTTRCDFVPEQAEPVCVALVASPKVEGEPCGPIGECHEDYWCTPLPAELLLEGEDALAACLPPRPEGAECEAGHTPLQLSADPELWVCAPER